MGNNQLNSLNISSLKGLSKDRAILLKFIQNQVAKGEGKPFRLILLEHSEAKRYYLALKHVTTTNKAICMAMQIPVEAGTRYKATLEKQGLLVSSTDEYPCPYTGDKAHLLTTNPMEFERLRKTKNNQLTLF